MSRPKASIPLQRSRVAAGPDHSAALLLVMIALLAGFSVLAWPFRQPGPAPPAQPLSLRTRNVLLISADGLRHQELFNGVDAGLLANPEQAGLKDTERLKRLYWRSTPEQRRRLLLPFFWNILAPQGVVMGNAALGSAVTVTNLYRVSSPGYAEILVGRALPEIQGNDPIRIAHPTVLDFVRDSLQLDRTGVGAFASWDVLGYTVTARPGSIVQNTGYEPFPDSLKLEGAAHWNRLQADMLTPWDSVRHDAVTAGLALAFLKQYRPRLLYIALGETDDWAHARRYDRVISSIRLFDDFLRDLWALLQSLPEYRDRTTLILTTDHGRGSEPDDWTGHGREVAGSDAIWLAVIGPDTPNRGEVAGVRARQSQVAATLLRFFGLERASYHSGADLAVDEVFP